MHVTNPPVGARVDIKDFGYGFIANVTVNLIYIQLDNTDKIVYLNPVHSLFGHNVYDFEKYVHPYIVCAANKYVNSHNEEIVIAGARHTDSVIRGVKKKLTDLDIKEEGFIDQFGNFWTRTNALAIVTHPHSKQKIDWERNGSATELFSEGLY